MVEAYARKPLDEIHRYFPIRKDFPMDISLIIKVAGVGILVSVATQILSKSGRDEQSMLVTLAGIVVVLLLLVDEIALLFDRICAVFGF